MAYLHASAGVTWFPISSNLIIIGDEPSLNSIQINQKLMKANKTYTHLKY